MNKSRLASCIGDALHGYTLLCLEETDSTSSETRRRAAEHGGGFLVTADTQTGGRGRLGRSFSSGPGGMYMSFSYRPDFPATDALHLTALTALAVCDAVEECCAVRPEIKWPNDLLLGGKKLCGILVEAVHTGESYFLIAGIGINVSNAFPPEVPNAVSLLGFTGRAPETELLAARVFCRTLDIFSRSQSEKPQLLAHYAERCVTIGRRVHVSSAAEGFDGEAVGIDENAALLVRRPDGATVPVFSGEATLSALG